MLAAIDHFVMAITSVEAVVRQTVSHDGGPSDGTPLETCAADARSRYWEGPASRVCATDATRTPNLYAVWNSDAGGSKDSALCRSARITSLPMFQMWAHIECVRGVR
jgi:hypothetical protein